MPVGWRSALLPARRPTAPPPLAAAPLSPPFAPQAAVAQDAVGGRAGKEAKDSAAADAAAYSRKDKSLSLLCESFVLYCSSAANCPGGVVSLDTCAAHLGVERRRIYDVTNILGALGGSARARTCLLLPARRRRHTAPAPPRARARRGAGHGFAQE